VSAQLELEDVTRQATQRQRILDWMLGHGEPRSLNEIRAACGGSDTGNSAALRRLRKEGCSVSCKRAPGAVWLYCVRLSQPGQ